MKRIDNNSSTPRPMSLRKTLPTLLGLLSCSGVPLTLLGRGPSSPRRPIGANVMNRKLSLCPTRLWEILVVLVCVGLPLLWLPARAQMTSPAQRPATGPTRWLTLALPNPTGIWR